MYTAHFCKWSSVNVGAETRATYVHASSVVFAQVALEYDHPLLISVYRNYR